MSRQRPIVHVCSFCEAEGSTVIAGKEWRWEFHSYLGPMFLRKDGEPLARQPGPRHPVWDRFAEWLKEYEAKKLDEDAENKSGSPNPGGMECS